MKSNEQASSGQSLQDMMFGDPYFRNADNSGRLGIALSRTYMHVEVLTDPSITEAQRQAQLERAEVALNMLQKCFIAFAAEHSINASSRQT